MGGKQTSHYRCAAYTLSLEWLSDYGENIKSDTLRKLFGSNWNVDVFVYLTKEIPILGNNNYSCTLCYLNASLVKGIKIKQQ